MKKECDDLPNLNPNEEFPVYVPLKADKNDIVVN
jgi:hypothetical protein